MSKEKVPAEKKFDINTSLNLEECSELLSSMIDHTVAATISVTGSLGQAVVAARECDVGISEEDGAVKLDAAFGVMVIASGDTELNKALKAVLEEHKYEVQSGSVELGAKKKEIVTG